MKTAVYFIQPMDFTGIPNTDSWAGYDFLQWTGDTYHPGLDYNYGAGEEDKGKPVLCIGNGVVEKCITWDGKTKGFGNHVFVKHTLEDGSVWYSHYCHLDSITCKEGQDIEMGNEIGKCGGSGGWPSHLHLELRKPIGKGYEFWPKPSDGYNKEWIAANYCDPYGFIEKRKQNVNDCESKLQAEIKAKNETYQELTQWQDRFTRVCEALDDTVDIDVVLVDIEKLKGMEQIAKDRQRDLEVKTSEANNLLLQIQKLEQDKKDIQGKLDTTQTKLNNTQKEVITLGINITALTTEVEALKSDKPLNGYSKWELFKKLIGF